MQVRLGRMEMVGQPTDDFKKYCASGWRSSADRRDVRTI